MGGLSAYHLVIGASVVIIFSYLFGIVARKTNIPSVLMLLALGYGSQFVFKISPTKVDWLFPLEILGIIGLILIVLEAALDLELRSSKIKLIRVSTIIALISLFGNTFFWLQE